jgi:2-polyprenyl-3-methyl-5-hydroxy-6-metoxy-1,4-benzoquinol methylase
MIRNDGWSRFNIWEQSRTVRELYEQRCLGTAEEMTCHAQAAELLRPLASPGDSLLDAGCGSGYFYHTLRRRSIDVEYFGIDATAGFIEIGRRHLPSFGLPPENLYLLRIEDLDAEVDHAVCINVLSNIDNYHKPLERLLVAARKSVILRESCSDTASYAYVRDHYLDEGVALNVYINTYPIGELVRFIESYGFGVRTVLDQRSGGAAEIVIGYPHHWKFLVCTRKSGSG